MSSWHARGGTPDGNSYRILFHIPIPSANNRVSVNYRTALVGSGIGGTTEMTEGTAAGQITTAEKADIIAGNVLEVAEMFDTNPGQTAAQLQAAVDARYTALANVNGDFITALQNRLAYWGKDRIVP